MAGILAVAFFAVSPGCEESRRVPYITPELHNWSRPYRGVAGLVLHVFATGSISGNEGLLLRGGSLTRSRDLPVFAYVLEHPKRGLVVWDTGLGHRLAGAADKTAPKLFNFGAHPKIEPGQDLPAQMRAAGLEPSNVRWVLVSNLSYTHAGEVEAFPDARIVVSRAEHQASRDGGSGYTAADVDEVPSWKFVDFDDAMKLATMPAAVDFFEDGSVLLLDARGPTRGNLALLVRLPKRPVLLAGDLAPTGETLRFAAEPVPLADRDAWWDRIWRLKRFKDLEPLLLVVPGHDIADLRAAGLGAVRVHESARATPESHPSPTPRLLPSFP